MTDTRVAAATNAAAGPIEAIGATWMLHPEQFEASTQAGYPHPFAGYMAGRAGVLGEVDARIVDSVLAVFHPDVIDAMWSGGLPVHGAKGGSELYFGQAAEWANRHLAGAEGLDRIVELGEKIINAAPTFGLPLFTGWKNLPRTDDTTGRAMQVLLDPPRAARRHPPRRRHRRGPLAAGGAPAEQGCRVLRVLRLAGAVPGRRPPQGHPRRGRGGYQQPGRGHRRARR